MAKQKIVYDLVRDKAGNILRTASGNPYTRSRVETIKKASKKTAAKKSNKVGGFLKGIFKRKPKQQPKVTTRKPWYKTKTAKVLGVAGTGKVVGDRAGDKYVERHQEREQFGSGRY